jgi:hypothetical protein
MFNINSSVTDFDVQVLGDAWVDAALAKVRCSLDALRLILNLHFKEQG